MKKSQTIDDDEFEDEDDHADTDTGFQKMAISPGTIGLGSTSNKSATF